MLSERSESKQRESRFMYYVYILECSNKALYTGITTDLERRFNQHRVGDGGHYTRSNRPIKIRYYETCESRSEALKCEAQIKRWSRTKKLALVKALYLPMSRILI